MYSATLRSHIDVRLIEKALAITWKTMEDIPNYTQDYHEESFCYYLLSPEFIEKYTYDFSDVDENWNATKFWKAIYEYQLGNPKHLISLLEKI